MVILLLRRCQRCDRDRFVPDEIAGNHRTCRACSVKRFKRQHPTKPCHGCGSRRRRAPRTRYCARCRPTPAESNRAASARYMAKLRADPQRWAAYLDGKRIDYRLRHNSPPMSVAEYERRYGPSGGNHYNTDATPLVPLMREWLDDDPNAARDHYGDRFDAAHSIKRLVRESGVSDRAIRRILNGETQRCSVLTADRLALALGTHIDLIYSDAPGVPR